MKENENIVQDQTNLNEQTQDKILDISAKNIDEQINYLAKIVSVLEKE